MLMIEFDDVYNGEVLIAICSVFKMLWDRVALEKDCKL